MIIKMMKKVAKRGQHKWCWYVFWETEGKHGQQGGIPFEQGTRPNIHYNG